MANERKTFCDGETGACPGDIFTLMCVPEGTFILGHGGQRAVRDSLAEQQSVEAFELEKAAIGREQVDLRHQIRTVRLECVDDPCGAMQRRLRAAMRPERRVEARVEPIMDREEVANLVPQT